jgi:uncharacterized membrane protein YagU involved in acid resistance
VWAQELVIDPFQKCREVFFSMPDDKSPYLKLIQGAAAGMIATVPMTFFMRSAWKRLPAQELYALPPRQITRNVLRPHRFFRLSPEKQTMLTLLMHFLFGAAAGSAYGMVEERIPLRESVKGPLAGLTVWAGSYLGWIPALGILPPATGHPWRRNAMMIVAHLIWGMVLGVLAGVTNSRKSYIKIQ